jgi:hypothetical protein
MAGSNGCDSVTDARADARRQEYPMKTSVLGLALAMSVLFTVPALARGGWPPMVGPSYPYPSYCEQCGAWWVTAPAPARPVVRHYKPRPRPN